MLEKPTLPETKIAACIHNAYGLDVSELTFLPLGADAHTAVYRLLTPNQHAYFLKLRSGVFQETAVTLPKFLYDQGVSAIIPPIPTADGQLWAELDPFKAMLYAYVNGRNARQVKITPAHWQQFGAALRQIHTIQLPPTLRHALRQETHTPQWRKMVKGFLARLNTNTFVNDPIANDTRTLLQTRHDEIQHLVLRAEQLAQTLITQQHPFVLCHADMHASNILIDDNNGSFFIIDWDDPMLAPKERDLMFIGGAQGFTGYTAAAEETLFYQGYGSVEVNADAVAYYRYERIIEDIALFCEDLLLSDEGGDDRAQALIYLQSNFLPNSTIEAAYRADRSR
ncbi:MAG: aminoglycoside phosphotransferase family protein [Chloroflexota bacterium]